MREEELYEDIEDESFTQKHLGLSLSKFLFFFLIVSFLAIYTGLILYGTNSIEVLLELQDYQHYLETQITTLKTENAELQKEYFELKEISAD